MTDAVLPYIEAISMALSALEVRSGERALVSGDGQTALRAAEALERMTGLAVLRAMPGEAEGAIGSRQAPEVDVLVDTSGDADWWGLVLGRVRRQGRVLLLIPPGKQSVAFDFYSRVHRGSLTLLVRRVPALA